MGKIVGGDDGLCVALGLTPGASWLRKFGRNADVDTGAPATIWDGVGLYTGFSAAAQTMKVLGANATDAVGQTGAEIVRLFGLDASYNEITEDVNLAGASDSDPTTQLFLRVNRVKVVQAGSGKMNVGSITVQQTTSGNVHAIIPIGKNITHQAVWTVPAGKTLLLKRVFISVTAGSSTNIEADLVIDHGGNGIFESSELFDVDEDGGPFSVEQDWLPIGQQSDIDFRVVATSQNNVKASGGFRGIIVNNDTFNVSI